jgi:hypothetical protein
MDAVMDKLCQELNELISAPENFQSFDHFPDLRIAF